MTGTPSAEKEAPKNCDLVLATCNANSWASARLAVEWCRQRFPEQEPDIFGIQETLLRNQGEVIQAKRWAAARGMQLTAAPAFQTWTTSRSYSAGVGVLTKARFAAATAQHPSAEAFASRLAACRVDLGFSLDVLVVSIYLVRAGLGGLNLQILGALAALVVSMQLPFVVNGDFNLPPAALQQSG